MTVVRGRVWDKASGKPLEARVRLRGSTGLTHAPADAVHKQGPGEPFFFCPGTFEVDVLRGQLDVLVERGTEYRPYELVVDVPPSGVVELDLPLERWVRPAERGWYAGNTHVHYDEHEHRPLDRLRLDPRVEDLPVFVVSQLKRRELPYASNAFPIGRHHFSTHDHVIDVGEESRHNFPDGAQRQIGLGHIMLINLREVVEPISRGILVDDAAPDYPPLVDACDGAREQGGVVLWCHNANGMEAPIAAALGRLDGLNLFDPYWMDPEYELWYRLLNCGIRLPASTGSDWFVSSANRVYADVGASFSYENWLTGLKAGRTLVTDGPILRLAVEGRDPSNDLLAAANAVEVAVEWEWHQPVDRVEIVRDGEVIAAFEEGSTVGAAKLRLDTAGAGWVAARAWGRRRNSYGHALWAHTSPVYLRERPEAARVRDAAGFFLERIDRARDWIGAKARFENGGQRDRMLQLFAEGRAVYEGLARA